MSIECQCPSCREVSLFEASAAPRRARCPVCQSPVVVPALADADNPYAAPKTPLDAAALGFTHELGPIPRDFIGKLALAFRLFFENLAVIAPLVLVVWLPGNIIVSALQTRSDQDPATSVLAFQVNNVIHGVFGPLYEGAIVVVLARRLVGERVPFSRALGEGFRAWGRLFVARLLAGILTTLGFIALVVPGIYLTVRYSLLDPVVVLERHPRPRSRSGALVKGRGWEILGIYVLILLVFIPFMFASQLLLATAEALNTVWASVVVGCVSDVAAVLPSILLFLYYADARSREDADGTAEVTAKPVADLEVEL